MLGAKAEPGVETESGTEAGVEAETEMDLPDADMKLTQPATVRIKCDINPLTTTPHKVPLSFFSLTGSRLNLARAGNPIPAQSYNGSSPESDQIARPGAAWG